MLMLMQVNVFWASLVSASLVNSSYRTALLTEPSLTIIIIIIIIMIIIMVLIMI